MKRLAVVLFVLLPVVVVAAACGSDDPQPVAVDGDEPVSSDDPPDADPPDAGEPPVDEPLGDGPYPVADLTVTYEHPDVGSVEYQIVCLGDTATLLGDVEGVRDQEACAALAEGAVQDRLIVGAPTDVACTEIYGGPETARFVGAIDDQAVDTTVDRANGCGIDDWDRVLAALLPPPRPFS